MEVWIARGPHKKQNRRTMQSTPMRLHRPLCAVGTRLRITQREMRVWAVWPAVAVAFTCAHPICTDRMRTGKRNRHRRPDSPDPNPKSKRDDISLNQLT
ncbi:hypothetical protein EVAR_28899_1 [Eumeta japonica]|uniref:Uncharacterized protein n=1 Tax=Eumeta variegata TaxID=151549 RepID=A0A4C1X1T4_EUMVA|nr:hypothetical protein EVAR_28899_1 [Eumeta japonica]